jgi:carboxypeptidase Taq
MTDNRQTLEKHFKRLARIDHALTFLHWDHMVMMPPGGNQSRSEAIAELTALRHELLTARELGDRLGQAAESVQDPMQSQSIKEMTRMYERAVCLPADLVQAKSLAGSICEHGWRSQRKDNDWPGFLANFQEVVRLARIEARARCDFQPGRFPTPYDALLDLYCTGDSSSFIAAVFTRLKQELPDLVQTIVAKQQNEPVVDLRGKYPIEHQQQLNRELMSCLGFDFNRGRQDVSAHPFSTGCRGDQRITTRYRDSEFLEALLATAHETGHAAYEDGLPAEWDGLPIGLARNMCLHESQSLLFEKQLFLSRPFLTFFSSFIHSHLPAAARLDSTALWTGATRVQPSYIRVEADEVTYPLHIILRYEIESGLINGTLAAGDIPEAWEAKMNEYLGLSTKGNYTDGCMQDMHWSDGSFGYFPSYTIGALNSAQLAAAIRRRHPDWQEQLGKGQVGFIRQWLGQNIWSKASSMDSREIVRAASGEETNPDYFLRHIRDRYLSGLY